MSQIDVIQVQPVKLTQKLGRYTKGLMTSIAIILISSTIGIIGIQLDVYIMKIVSFVVTGLSGIIFLVFLILFLTSIKRLGRTNNAFFTSANKIFFASIYGLIFAAAGGANSYTEVQELLSQFILSRLYGMIAALLFGFAFLSIRRLFKEFKQHGLYEPEQKSEIFLPIIMSVILLIVLTDTIIRPFVSEVMLTYITLAVMFVVVSILCFFLYTLGNNWLKIEDELNDQYFKMGGKTFNDKFKNNILSISMMLIVIAFLSLIYVIYYFVKYVTGGLIEELILSIGIFVGLIVLLLVIYIIRISLNFNKMAQLNTETSNFGIFTAISLSFSPFLLIAGFFSNIFFLIDEEFYIISRILMFLGLVLFTAGSFFNSRILKNLKLNKEGFRDRKREFLLPISSLALTVILIIDTFVRLAAFNAYGGSAEQFNLRYLWLGYVFGALFFLAIIPTIYGLITTSKEYLKVIPAYGKIPLRLRKSKLDEQLQLYQAQQDMIPSAKAVAFEPTDKPVAVQFCSSCGKELQERFNFCAFCGDKKDTKINTCKNCGDVLEKGFKFCPKCGTKK